MKFLQKNFILKVKTGLKENLEEPLTKFQAAQGELFYCTDTQELFIASHDGGHDDFEFLILNQDTIQISDADGTATDIRDDIGTVQDSNVLGYYKDFVTNKILFNSKIGSNNNIEDGGIGWSGNTPFVYKDGVRQDILIGIDIRQEIDNTIIFHPFESAATFFIHSGDSEQKSGILPIIQGYSNSTIGAVQVPERISGGVYNA
jgi:hypothetical protein